MAAVLNNSHGVEVHLIPTGAVIQRLLLPDASGQVADVVLGFDTIEPYRDGTSPYFGAVVGRVANRIANATFELDGQRYELAANNGPNCLHGKMHYLRGVCSAASRAVPDKTSANLRQRVCMQWVVFMHSCMLCVPAPTSSISLLW